jgi:hypothetical protein
MTRRLLCAIAALLLFLLCSCGSTQTLYDAVPGAAITINDSLTIQGALLHETDSTVTIVAFGIKETYRKADVRKVEHRRVPDWQAVLAEADRNSADAAKASSAMLVVSGISLLISVLFVILASD